MALAAVGTFLATDRPGADEMVEVLVASRDLRIGETIGAEAVELVPVRIEGDVRGLFGSVEAVVGRRVVAAVGEGEFVQASATSTVPGAETLELAVTVPVGRAVGGLRPGDRVDVFATWAGEVTELVAVDARVLDTRGGAERGLASSDSVVIRLGLRDFTQVEALVHAQAAGDITMIRAAPDSTIEDLGRSYRPGRTSAAATAGTDDSPRGAEEDR